MDLRERIDKTLKDYGVDWKLDDNEYYEALKDELIIIINKKN